MIKMNAKEKEMIRLMRTGKRVNISEIARKMGMPVSTVSDRIRKIEDKYIVKRASLLDYASLGYHANARIAVKIDPARKQEFLEFLQNEECVNSIYHINDRFDFMIDCVWKDAIHRKDWICRISSIFSPQFQIFNIIKPVERERFMPK